MKNKQLKKWVVNKRKSISDIFSNGRPIPENLSTAKMEHDSMSEVSQNLSSNQAIPAKVVFYAKGNPFRIDPRYSFVRILGQGAYGVVCAADDILSEKRVAVKKVKSVFEDLTDAKRIIREIRLLGWMEHENILSIIDMDEPENYDKFADVYLVTEFMDTDLNKLLQSGHKLLESQRKFFTYQMLSALKYIHR